ncbi:MAG: hypothetical protein QM533_11560 [Cytophagales bacterium]|nr:hypothetical protein [Cytophagales bacterium]
MNTKPEIISRQEFESFKLHNYRAFLFLADAVAKLYLQAGKGDIKTIAQLLAEIEVHAKNIDENPIS